MQPSTDGPAGNPRRQVLDGTGLVGRRHPVPFAGERVARQRDPAPGHARDVGPLDLGTPHPQLDQRGQIAGRGGRAHRLRVLAHRTRPAPAAPDPGDGRLPAGERRQQPGEFGAVVGDDDEPLLHRFASGVQGVRDVGQRHPLALQERPEATGVLPQP
ncbi:hypothetical protein ABTY53_37825, partial [Streptomyces noursei]